MKRSKSENAGDIKKMKTTVDIMMKYHSIESGSIRVNRDEIEFEWTISDFFSLPEETQYHRISPHFKFLGSSWLLYMYPNLEKGPDSDGWIALTLLPAYHVVAEVIYSFSLKTVDGRAVAKKDFCNYFACDGGDEIICAKFISRSELIERSSELAPGGAVTIIFSIRPSDSNREIGTITHNRKITVEKSTQAEHGYHLDALSQSFKAFLLDGDCHNVTLKVKGREFRAHQNILSARSPVFDSVLEKNNGVISIDDCDPAVFEQFLLYIYSGRLEVLDQSNMLGLYYIADKYNMPELKEESLEFIINSLSPTVICDVIRFATNHSDSALLSHATEHFIESITEIPPDVEWQTFMMENETLTDELLMKPQRPEIIRKLVLVKQDF